MDRASLLITVSLTISGLLGCSSAQPPSGSAPPQQMSNGGTSATAGASSAAAAASDAGSASIAGSASDGGGAGATSQPSAGTGGAAPIPGPVDKSACLLGAGSGKTLYVSAIAVATGDGTSFASALNLPSALAQAAPGDTVLLEPGKYTVPYVEGAKNTLVLAQKATADERIRVIADAGGRAEIDFSFPDQSWVQDSFGFLVSGSYWSLCGIDVTRAGYQGVYVTGEHNTFENCTFHDNRNTGLEINKGGAYTTVVNCDSYRNYDPKKLGSMADGFGPKETQGPGNRFVGCRAWENSDDGYDAYNSAETVIFQGCYAFRNGVDVWSYGGFAGNGNGFKVGGLAKQANHVLTQCAAFANRVKGFDQNNNTGGLTLYNCTAFQNGTNFGLGGTLNAGQQHDVRNNVSLDAPITINNAVQKNNSWDLGIMVTAADFENLDVAQGSAARAADGSLADSDFLRLAPASALIDRGVDVGLPFNGLAPDLGAYESP
jgi:hypothetical protein